MAEPNAFEQLTLELINQARLDPLGEFARLVPGTDPVLGAEPAITDALLYFGVDPAVLWDQVQSLAPVQPLAWNSQLGDAAEAHSQRMITADNQSHQLPGEADLGDRVTVSGYENWSLLAENIFAYSESALYGHAGFFIDWGGDNAGMQNPAGHRDNIMNGAFAEVGIGVLAENDPATGVGPFVTTVDFGNRWDYAPQFVGVAYDDTNHNGFYSMGEGLGGLSVAVTSPAGEVSAKTMAEGGYSLAGTSGQNVLTFSGGHLGLPVSITVQFGAENVKVDVVDGVTLQVSVSAALGQNAHNLKLLGSAAINGTGNMLDNLLVGNRAANELYGDGGNDRLDGGAGADTMSGGVGNDTYYTDNDADVTTETSALVTEIDTVVSTVGWTLGANIERLTLSGTAAINGTGNALDNSLTGNAGNNALAGGEGDDSLDGAGGNDSLDGGSGADTMSGGVGNDVLNGAAGTDRMLGGIGNDTYYVDDTADVTTETSTLATEIDTVVSTVGWTLETNIERLLLSGAAAINGAGNGLNNTLTGNAAANTLSGEGGNDVLNGAAGADRMLGGTGSDIYYIDNASDGTTETSALVTEIDTVVSMVGWTLGANIERLVLSGAAAINGTGNALNNTLTGNALANTLNGWGGNDVLVGGASADRMLGGTGNDTFYVDNASDVTTETSTLATEIDTVVSTVGWTLGANIELLVLAGAAAINGAGNMLNNTLTGNALANTLSGGAGNDVLNGAAGADKMLGGAGNDTYYIDLATDRVYETTTLTGTVNAGGVDRVISTVGYSLGSFVENLTLAGTAAINGTGNGLNNSLTGNAAANTLNGAAGNDVLSGAAGNDALIGGLGNDSLISGGGKDTFLFDTTLNASTNRDSLTDFSVVDDTIRLDRTIFARLTTLGTLNSAWFKASATGKATDSNDYLLYNTTTGALLYDKDATGAGAAVQFAALTTKPKLTAADFVVVA